MKLYPFQKEGVRELVKGFEKHPTQCLSWYTGAGKTNVIAELCRHYVRENPRIKIGISAYLITQIKDQVTDRLALFGLSEITQKIMAGVPLQQGKSIFVFNPQTIHRRDLPLKFDLIIVDEGHAGIGPSCKMLSRILRENSHAKTKTLIVSATPWDTLALKKYAGIPVLKRPLDYGIADGLVCDFKFHAEAAQITFTEADFTRTGDLGRSATQKHMAILKSACLGKLHHIVDKYDLELGKKVIVICPPGNFTEIPRTLSEEFHGLTYVQKQLLDAEGEHGEKTDQELNLEQFRTDPKVRFLFVANKCSVGFDMPELTSIVDLTMSRNIRTLAQRVGRIARKHENLAKHYFYVYDQSLMKDQLEWLVATMIDFCLGSYDGWTTKTAKYRKTTIGNWDYRAPFSITLGEIVRALREPELIQNVRSISYLAAHGPPTRWTLTRAKAKAQEYESRTDMWAKNPALYKWFRLNAKSEMDEIFPLRNRTWDEKKVIASMKKCKSRSEWAKRFSGAGWWVRNNGRDELSEKYLPAPQIVRKWDHDTITNLLQKTRTWSHIRSCYPGARRWMCSNGGETMWRSRWKRAYAKSKR